MLEVSRRRVSAASRDWARRKCSNFCSEAIYSAEIPAVPDRSEHGTGCLQPGMILLHYRNDECPCHSGVGFRIPWCIRRQLVSFSCIKRSLCRLKCFGRFSFWKGLKFRNILFAGNTEDFRELLRKRLVEITSTDHVISFFLYSFVMSLYSRSSC